MQTELQSKSLWGGEIGLVGVLGLLGLLCIYIAANTVEPAFAFHMGLGVVAAALGVFAIFQRFSARPAEPPPLEIGGLPNYNFAPVKVATLFALFWGLAGMAVGVYIACELAFPRPQHRAVVQLRPTKASAHLGGDFRFRRQRAACDLVLCCAAHLAGASGR